ncbi:hypothetical protein BJ912DRAFT_970645 [Pholiota molesta]|nr:hypothetical protein BJ912DRAFT_970645 [Pholiota molesta]
MLHMGATQCIGPARQYPLEALFDNLRLPALRTLSLKSQAMTWYNTTALTEVHAALLSAPALTTLALGVSFLGDLIYNATPEYLGLKAIGSDAEPLAAYAPRLEHLSFAMATPLRRRGAFDFVARAFAPRHWLDLKNATSTIRAVTFVASGAPPDDLDWVAERTDRRLLIAEVRRFVRDEVGVGFTEEDPLEGWRTVWGW